MGLNDPLRTTLTSLRKTGYKRKDSCYVMTSCPTPATKHSPRTKFAPNKKWLRALAPILVFATSEETYRVYKEELNQD
jgi:hypothetical protein